MTDHADSESAATDLSAADPGVRPIRRALLSVYDKTGLVDLATALHGAGVSLVSTGNTARTLSDAGIPVTPVEEVTGFPECLDGRVKTLHPRIHGGLLADTRKHSHLDQLAELDIEPFDLVVSNLYPFRETVASGATPDECVEQIDIGGPSMIRAAAKNHPSVAIVVQPSGYPEIHAALAAGGFTVRPAEGVGRHRLRAHRQLRRGGGLVDAHRALAGRGRLAGLDRRDLGAAVDPALRREPAPERGAVPALASAAWPPRSRCTARR